MSCIFGSKCYKIMFVILTYMQSLYLFKGGKYIWKKIIFKLFAHFAIIIPGELKDLNDGLSKKFYCIIDELHYQHFLHIDNPTVPRHVCVTSRGQRYTNEC